MRSWILAFLLAAGLTCPAVARPVIGMAAFEIVDTMRADPVRPAERRRWRVTIYYPASVSARAQPAPYAPDTRLIAAMAADGYYDVPTTTLQGWLRKPGPAFASAPVRARAPLPLITLSPGSGVAAFNYGEIASALAARGYAVAVIDHPYLGVMRLGDGRILRASDDPLMQQDDPKAWAPRVRDWSRDISLVIDRLMARRRPAAIPPGLRIDPRRIVVTGHSLGGSVALQACSDDPRIEACADFEGTPEPSTAFTQGTRKPTLMTAARSAKPDRLFKAPALGDPNWAFLAKGAQRSNWAIAITKASHMSYSDAPREMPDTLSRFGGVLVTSARSFAMYSALVDAFARAYAPGGGGDAAFAAFLASMPEMLGTRSGVTEPNVKD